MRTLSSGLLLALALAGCQWSSRPDGGSPEHTDNVTQTAPLPEAVVPDDGAIVEPLDGNLTEAPPTVGTDDASMPVDTVATAP